MQLQSRRWLPGLQILAAARPLQGLAALLLATLPGAMLACIIHCSLPFSTQGGLAPSPYLCDHMVDTGGDLPPPVSTGVVQALVQAFIAAEALAAATMTLLPQALIGAPATRRARLGDGPPTPPPRPAAAP